MESDGGPDDPRRLIFDFLSRLPDTIRLDVLAFVVIYATRTLPPDPSRDAIKESVRALLFDTDDTVATGAVICASAAIDFILERTVAEAAENAVSLKVAAARIPGLEATVLGHPQRARHYERALADWRAMRSTYLTTARLRSFEKRLWRFR